MKSSRRRPRPRPRRLAEEFAQAAAAAATTARVEEMRKQMPNQQIILGLDRLDYTKGIPYRLRAFHLALTRCPELHRNVTLLQVVVPSREGVPEYQDLRAQIERLVTQINGEFTQPGWVPIHHVFRSLERDELVAYYRVADVALVTPLKDGMNLVAKEYCACQVDGNGVLILSEFAGAALQLRRDAILVNPYDLDHAAEAIRKAVSMTPEQRRPSMRRLRNLVRRQDVFWWVDRFLNACEFAGAPTERTETELHPVAS
jgi:trehalose 6-phosphate synthase/phosphatase